MNIHDSAVLERTASMQSLPYRARVHDEEERMISALAALAPQAAMPNAQQVTVAAAEAYLRLYHREQGRSEAMHERLLTVRAEIETTRTYWQTADELAYGAKVAWRNNGRCIGRLNWKVLDVRDMRHLRTAEEVFDACVAHILHATNGGRLRSTITVFAPQQPGQPGIRIWNPQLIRYAGYRGPDGNVVGDRAYVELTAIARRLGWKGGGGTPFDLLPLIIQMPGQEPQLFSLPPEVVLEVPITHPDYPLFAELGLKWHALPAIANFRMEIGGVSYTAAPFNGWYMSTEIAARNFSDTDRYNLLPVIAKRMGLDTSNDRTLWKDRALLELNAAVLHSFAECGATIVDHHAASRQFIKHIENESTMGRSTPADWTWIVPPVSGSTTPVFHRLYEDVSLTPNYFTQPDPWRMTTETTGCPFAHKDMMPTHRG